MKFKVNVWKHRDRKNDPHRGLLNHFKTVPQYKRCMVQNTINGKIVASFDSWQSAKLAGWYIETELS